MPWWRVLLAIVILPGTVTVAVPAWLLHDHILAHVGWGLSFPALLVPLLLGSGLLSMGLWLMIRTITLFATVGRGSLAPWDAPRRLVVEGVYRHVRNPMISGVAFVLAGETALFGSSSLLEWLLIFLVINGLYMPLVEERGLERRFGDEYLEYKANVPRWIPRRAPWIPPARS